MSRPHANVAQPAGQRFDSSLQLGERCDPGAALTQLGDRRSEVTVGGRASRDTDNPSRSRLVYQRIDRHLARPCRGLRSHPGPGILGRLRRILYDQMGGLGVPLDIRMRQPALQLAKRSLPEDRISWAPQQQRRNGCEFCHSEGHPIERGAAGMAGLQGDVGDEITDGPAASRVGIRRPQCSANLGRDPRSGQCRCGADECRRAYADQLSQYTAACQSDEHWRA